MSAPPPWTAEVELTPAEARSLIEGQFPELAPARLEPLGQGWDNWAYRVNRDRVFRFPRRQVAVGLLEREIAVLPLLAEALDLPVPVPRWVGEPSGSYPWPFAGYPMLPGRTACSLELPAEARAALAAPLGRFLGQLHAAAAPAELLADAPPDPFRKTDLPAVRTARVEVLERLGEEALPVEAASVRSLLEELSGTLAWTGEPRWVHGDFYARHLLVDEDAALCGVLDWGDVTRSDPALDLSVAWSFLPASAREAFFSEYGETDPPTRDRARFRALGYGLVLLDYGRDIGDPDLVRAGSDALLFATG